MSWQASVRAAEARRAHLTWHLWIGGLIESGRECALTLEIAKPGLIPLPGEPLPGLLSPPRRIKAIIDTGCTNSAIRYDLAAELGLPVIGRREVSTASSGSEPIDCPTVAADVLMTDPNRLQVHVFSELVVQDMEDDMLLGMDLLGGGVLTVDLVAGYWDRKYYGPPKEPDS